MRTQLRVANTPLPTTRETANIAIPVLACMMRRSVRTLLSRMWALTELDRL
jgi:hypothetical protein